MTYQTKKAKHKRRIEIIMAIFLVIGVNVCHALYLSFSEGVLFWQAVKQIFNETLIFVILLLLGLSLIFVFRIVGRLIRQAWNKK